VHVKQNCTDIKATPMMCPQNYLPPGATYLLGIELRIGYKRGGKYPSCLNMYIGFELTAWEIRLPTNPKCV
jgi:hypothetical protein